MSKKKSNNVTTTNIYQNESEWLWKLKKRLKKPNSQEVLKSLHKLMILHKMEGELK